MVGVILCSKARRLSAASRASMSAMRMIGGARELHGEAGVEHVGRGHALMHEARFGADDSARCVRKAMTSCLVSRSISSMRSTSKVTSFALAQMAAALLRDHAQFGQRVAGVRLDLEPDFEARLRLPDRNHFGAGIAGDHGLARG
jgi:hypothetical protein